MGRIHCVAEINPFNSTYNSSYSTNINPRDYDIMRGGKGNDTVWDMSLNSIQITKLLGSR